jgi:predicted alternative tryptophan synthase beta-subunit
MTTIIVKTDITTKAPLDPVDIHPIIVTNIVIIFHGNLLINEDLIINEYIMIPENPYNLYITFGPNKNWALLSPYI